MKQQPDGFAISFNRYDRRKRWGWKQTKGLDASKAAGHTLRREGFSSRRIALNDLLGEVERNPRAFLLPSSRPQGDQATATTG